MVCLGHLLSNHTRQVISSYTLTADTLGKAIKDSRFFLRRTLLSQTLHITVVEG